MSALSRLSLCIILLTLCTNLGSGHPRRSPFSFRLRARDSRPPPRQLVRDPRLDKSWFEREAPDPIVSSSYPSSSATSASASSSGPGHDPSHGIQALDTSTSSGVAPSSTISSSAGQVSTSASASAPSSVIVSSQGTSSQGSSSGLSPSASSYGVNNSSLLDTQGWHFPYMALWNGTQPVLTDVKQVRMANCWMAAATIAVVYNNPDWVSRLFTYPDGTPMVGQSFPTSPEVVVTLWNPANAWKYEFQVNIYNESTTEDSPGGAWWHSALSQASSGMAQYPMAMMTGRAIKYNRVGTDGTLPTVDDFYSACANATFTPVVIASKGTVATTNPPIIANHDYAILSVDDRGQAGRFINTRNPWGTDETFGATDLFNNCFWLYIMDDPSPLVWQD